VACCPPPSSSRALLDGRTKGTTTCPGCAISALCGALVSFWPRADDGIRSPGQSSALARGRVVTSSLISWEAAHVVQNRPPPVFGIRNGPLLRTSGPPFRTYLSINGKFSRWSGKVACISTACHTRVACHPINTGRSRETVHTSQNTAGKENLKSSASCSPAQE
jgi:hypothetical protein